MLHRTTGRPSGAEGRSVMQNLEIAAMAIVAIAVQALVVGSILIA